MISRTIVRYADSSCTKILIQQNVDGSNFFDRSWAEFKVGFGDRSGNYWLGNDLLNQLTQQHPFKLRFDLEASDQSTYYAEYSSFVVSNEASNYMMQVSGASGNAPNADALLYNNDDPFTTYDRDNDQAGFNCAVRNGGGFWYSNCANVGVNVLKGSGHDEFEWYSTPLKHTRMWLVC